MFRSLFAFSFLSLFLVAGFLCVSQQHVQAQASGTQTGTIIETMDEYAEGDLKATAKIIENAKEYVGQVRPVFLQEDETIKSLKKILSKDELEKLNKKFEDFEYDWDGPQVQNYQKIVRELERKTSMIVW